MTEFATYPDLAGKVALVMGVGQSGPGDAQTWGNGAAIARVLSYNKVKIYGCDLSLGAAELTARRLRSEGGVCDVTTADVTKSSDVQRVVDAVMSMYGRIDVLVNNVGTTGVRRPSHSLGRPMGQADEHQPQKRLSRLSFSITDHGETRVGLHH